MTNREKLVLLLLVTVVGGYAQWELSVPAPAPLPKQGARFIPAPASEKVKVSKKKVDATALKKTPSKAEPPPVAVKAPPEIEMFAGGITSPAGEELVAQQRWDPIPLTKKSNVTRKIVTFSSVHDLVGDVDAGQFDKDGNLNHSSKSYAVLRQQLHDVVKAFKDYDLDAGWELIENGRVSLEFRKDPHEGPTFVGGSFGLRTFDNGKTYTPFIAIDIKMLVEADSRFFYTIARSFFHERQHYLFFERYSSFPGYLEMMVGKDTMSTEERCAWNWMTEFEAYYAEAFKQRSWGFDDEELAEAVGDIKVFRQRLFLRMTKEPKDDPRRKCYTTWAVLAGHPFPNSFEAGDPE